VTKATTDKVIPLVATCVAVGITLPLSHHVAPLRNLPPTRSGDVPSVVEK
jgi:hypothetical protein